MYKDTVTINYKPEHKTLSETCDVIFDDEDENDISNHNIFSNLCEHEL